MTVRKASFSGRWYPGDPLECEKEIKRFDYGSSPKGSGEKAVEWVRDENDRRVIDAMLAMVPEQVITEGLTHQNACCAGAAAAAIAAARELGAVKAEEIIHASSYDKSPGDNFVGYVGIVF